VKKKPGWPVISRLPPFPSNLHKKHEGPNRTKIPVCEMAKRQAGPRSCHHGKPPTRIGSSSFNHHGFKKNKSNRTRDHSGTPGRDAQRARKKKDGPAKIKTGKAQTNGLRKQLSPSKPKRCIKRSDSSHRGSPGERGLFDGKRGTDGAFDRVRAAERLNKPFAGFESNAGGRCRSDRHPRIIYTAAGWWTRHLGKGGGSSPPNVRSIRGGQSKNRVANPDVKASYPSTHSKKKNHPAPPGR